MSGTLALPLQTYGSDFSQRFNGLVVYHVDAEDGFIERGRVDHSTLIAAARQQRTCPQPDERRYYDWRCSPRAYEWMGSIQRSIVIDGYLVTASALGIQINQLEALKNTIGAELLARKI